MAKTKPLHKLKPINRMRKELAHLRSVVKSRDDTIQKMNDESDRRINRLGDEIRRKDIVIADKDKRAAEMLDEIKRRQNAEAAVIAERDRIIRLVDQFTSVQITPLGITLSPMSGGEGPNLPAKLRRT